MRHISLGTLSISDRGKDYVNNVLNTNRLSYGPYTRKFEQLFAELHECKHAIFMNSGTSALQVALAALREVHKYQDMDEVLVPATTFIASSNIVLQNNMRPVFVDVDPNTFNIDPWLIEEKITSRTRAIMPVHLLGLPADMTRIMPIARQYGLQVLEDSCETVFSKCDGKTVGSFGDFGTFSTYVNHLIVGGVGGLATTNDDKLAEISRSLLAHGRDSVYTHIDADNDLSGPKLLNIIERRFRFERVGYSYRATELEAAIALSELEARDSNIARRKQNAAHLMSALADLQDFLQLPIIPSGFDHVFMMFPLVAKAGVDRDQLLLFMEERGIETRFLLPLLSQPVYKKIFPGLDEKYPIAQNLARNGALIGIHQNLTEEDIQYISDTIHGYFKP
jgi:dTDP-4-amino-4,6-dideoxygalactose transaminase